MSVNYITHRVLGGVTKHEVIFSSGVKTDDNEMLAIVGSTPLAAVNTIEKKHFSSQYCVKANVRILPSQLHEITELPLQGKKTVQCKRLKNLETSLNLKMFH